MTDLMRPVEADKRNHLIDILRGFALFGVLSANLTGFITYALTEDLQQRLTTTLADKATGIFVSALIENKFITLFSLLFGYGFGVILERTAAKGISGVPFFLRRMIFLLLLGLIHLGIWWGEILSTYASCGLLLLLFGKANPRTLLISGMILLFVIVPGIQTIRWTLAPFPAETIDTFQRHYFQVMRTGDLARIMECNYQAADLFFLHRYAQLRDTAEILAKFLFGYYILRKGIFSATPSSSWTKKAWKITLPIASIYLVEHIYLDIANVLPKALPLKIILFTFDKCGILCLSTVYVLSITSFYRRYNNAFLLKCFQSIGRMSLTNYLTHTLCYVFIFYGIGLGLLGTIHLQWTIPLALVIYALQVVFSNCWLKRMIYGPAEWIWRQATYGKRLPLIRQQSPS